MEYPFIKSPACLPYNQDKVFQIAERVEQGLIKDDLHGAYCEQIRQFISRGVAVHLTAEEIASWSGPCQYIIIMVT